MFDTGQKKARNKYAVEVELDDGRVRTMFVFVAPAMRVIDVLNDGLSSVYTFYDPDWHGSLGTYGILWQLDYADRLGLPWLYLGYWIDESRKMAYKSRFRPLEKLGPGGWRRFDPEQRELALG